MIPYSCFEDFCNAIIEHVGERLDEYTPDRLIRWTEVFMLVQMDYIFGIKRKCVSPLWMIPKEYHWRLKHVEGEPEGCHEVIPDDVALAKELFAYRLQYDNLVRKENEEALDALRKEIEEELYRRNFSSMLKIYYGWMA